MKYGLEQQHYLHSTYGRAMAKGKKSSCHAVHRTLILVGIISTERYTKNVYPTAR